MKEMQRIFDALSREYEQSGKLKDTVFLTYQKENILKRLLKFVKAEYEYAKAWYGYKPLNVEMSFGPGTLLPLSLSDETERFIILKDVLTALTLTAKEFLLPITSAAKYRTPKI